MNFRLSALILLLSFSLLISVETDGLEHEEITALIKYYTANPININKATVSDIYQLPYISEIEAELIFQRIADKGEIKDIKVLFEEKIIGKDAAADLKRCVKYKDARDEIQKGEYSLRLRRTLEKSRAYVDSVYFGNPSGFTHKLSFYDKRISYNFLMEKEPGETDYSDNFKANFIIRDADRYRIIIGNFNLASMSGMLQKEGFTMDPYSYRSSSNFQDITKTAPTSTDYSGYNGGSGYYTLGKYRISAYYGQKKLASTISGTGEIVSVNLNAYSRTLTEIEKRHNSYHETYCAAFEGETYGIKFGFSASNEKFSRELSSDSKLYEGPLADIYLSKKIGAWEFRSDAATDMSGVNFKTNALFRTKNLNTDFYYGYIEKNKLSLTSASMMFGTEGDTEQVFGMKFLMKFSPSFIILSDNLIYATEYFGTVFPGAQYSIKSSIKTEKFTIEPAFIYKSKETATDEFVTSKIKEYSAKIKSEYNFKPFTAGFDAVYSDKNTGYGYILSPGFSYRSGDYKARAGCDFFYASTGGSVSSSSADIGKYPSMYTYSGKGTKSYLMAAYAPKNFEISAGISRTVRQDREYTGSGYDVINSDTVHEAEINFRYLF
ncbi:MAG TPA: hypothetical protein PLK90_10865 [Clostridiales bacterium]|nr:hypothetical protein [Clostridiales bacterium]HQP70891.1 hypothetical protein [Clostridiales bacterium]